MFIYVKKIIIIFFIFISPFLTDIIIFSLLPLFLILHSFLLEILFLIKFTTFLNHPILFWFLIILFLIHPTILFVLNYLMYQYLLLIKMLISIKLPLIFLFLFSHISIKFNLISLIKSFYFIQPIIHSLKSLIIFLLPFPNKVFIYFPSFISTIILVYFTFLIILFISSHILLFSTFIYIHSISIS